MVNPLNNVASDGEGDMWGKFEGSMEGHVGEQRTWEIEGWREKEGKNMKKQEGAWEKKIGGEGMATEYGWGGHTHTIGVDVSVKFVL